MDASLSFPSSYNDFTSPAYLEKLYHIHIKNKTTRGRDGVVAKALANTIGHVSSEISTKLRSGDYRFTSYRESLVSKGAGKYPRVLSIPTARDHIALKAIAILLQQLFPSCRGTRPQPLVQMLRDGLASGIYSSFVRIDIESFYPSIKHQTLLDLLARQTNLPQLVKVIKSAITTNTLSDGARRSRKPVAKGVPQGLPISNILAEISLKALDKEMNSIQDILYLRYVDDILILCDDKQAKPLFERVELLVGEMDLSVHPLHDSNSKSQIGSTKEEIGYLGYTFSPSKISVRDSSVDSIEASLVEIFTRYVHSIKQHPSDATWRRITLEECLWHLNLRITGCIFESKPRGWLPYYSQLTDLKLLKQRDASVERLMRRFEMPINFKPKTFCRAYWHLKHPNNYSSIYIPVFDRYSLDEMRDLLGSIFHITQISELNDDEIRTTFGAELRKLVRDLDKDVRPIS